MWAQMPWCSCKDQRKQLYEMVLSLHVGSGDPIQVIRLAQ